MAGEVDGKPNLEPPSNNNSEKDALKKLGKVMHHASDTLVAKTCEQSGDNNSLPESAKWANETSTTS